MAKLTRRESREIAFTLLFEWSFKENSLEEIIENAVTAREIVVDSFARELVAKTVENREELDSLIERYSQSWKLQRISKTTLAVLRMSFCELTKFGDIPEGVSINEAVELVKKFGTDEEAAYLNGILGNFVKVRKGQKEAPPLPEEKKTVSSQSTEEDTQQEYDEQKTHQAQQEQDEVELLDDIVIEVE